MKLFKRLIGATAIALSLALVGCGERVEVPPAHYGKVLTKDGYQEGLVPSSKFRLDPCWAYCDRLVILDASDQAFVENMEIFIPKDKLNLGVQLKTTLSVNPSKTEELFNRLQQSPTEGGTSKIENSLIYRTYAAQIIQAEVREYLNQYSIAEIASSNEKINSELRIRLSEVIKERTPFSVRYVGITGIKYPDIITNAQEKAAERREAIQQEEAQLKISQVRLERELKEARLQRAIDKERAETEADAQKALASTVDERVLKLRSLENQRLAIEKWDGKYPTTMAGDTTQLLHLNAK